MNPMEKFELVAKTLGLNPALNEIMQVEFKGQLVPLVTKDGLLKIAHRNGGLLSIEQNIGVESTPFYVNGKVIVRDEIFATCKITKDNNGTFETKIYFSEYGLKRDYKTGELVIAGPLWKDKQPTMLKKVALAQCIRLAFNISGVYIAEELEADSDFEPPIKSKEEKTHEEKKAPLPVDELKKSLLALNIEWEEKEGILTLLPNKELYSKRSFIKELGFQFDSQQKRWRIAV